MATSELIGLAAVPAGQHLREFGELGLGFLLSALIGAEREWRQKSAGLRTHTLVGAGAALFLLISKYGFSDVLGPDVKLDPSRVAAQIVTGIGFLGGGLIFVRGDAVRGLTTAAAVWLTAPIGMAAGAGLPLLAVATTGGYFVVVLGFPWLEARVPGSPRLGFRVRAVYEDGRGILRKIIAASTELGFAIAHVDTRELEHEVRGRPAVSAILVVRGQPSVDPLTEKLQELDGVLEVTVSDRAGSTE